MYKIKILNYLDKEYSPILLNNIDKFFLETKFFSLKNIIFSYWLITKSFCPIHVVEKICDDIYDKNNKSKYYQLSKSIIYKKYSILHQLRIFPILAEIWVANYLDLKNYKIELATFKNDYENRIDFFVNGKKMQVKMKDRFIGFQIDLKKGIAKVSTNLIIDTFINK